MPQHRQRFRRRKRPPYRYRKAVQGRRVLQTYALCRKLLVRNSMLPYSVFQKPLCGLRRLSSFLFLRFSLSEADISLFSYFLYLQLKTKNNSYLFIEHTVSANQDGPDVGDMVNETDIGWFDKFGITNVRVDDTLLIIPLSDSKTMKIHNLPTVLPSEKDTVWVDANRFIRLS